MLLAVVAILKMVDFKNTSAVNEELYTFLFDKSYTWGWFESWATKRPSFVAVFGPELGQTYFAMSGVIAFHCQHPAQDGGL